MNHLMDNKKQSTKKKIKVRKTPVSPIVSNTRIDDEEDYYIPVAAFDSTWSGISFKEPTKINIEHAQGISDDETEIRVIDCDSENDEATPPLLLLFPDLRKEDSQLQMPIMKGQISTTSLTKMLMGKKPRMSLLKSCKKPILQQQRMLSRVEEDTESDDSIKVVSNHKKKIKPFKDPPSFADISSSYDVTVPSFSCTEKEEITAIKNDTKKQAVSNSLDIKLVKSNENNSTVERNNVITETMAEFLGKKLWQSVKNDFSEDADISSDAILNDSNYPQKKRKSKVNKLDESEVGTEFLKVELKESKKDASDDRHTGINAEKDKGSKSAGKKNCLSTRKE